jgi:hypothetical protein
VGDLVRAARAKPWQTPAQGGGEEADPELALLDHHTAYSAYFVR